MVELLRMYSGLHAKLLTEIRADGVKAGSSFSPRPPCCLLRLCQMFLQDGFGFFFFFGFYLLWVQPAVVPHVWWGIGLAVARLQVAAKWNFNKWASGCYIVTVSKPAVGIWTCPSCYASFSICPSDRQISTIALTAVIVLLLFVSNNSIIISSQYFVECWTVY